MMKIYIRILFFFGVINVSAQETLWQRNVPSSTQDFLNSLSITVDGQCLVSGSSIQPSKDSPTTTTVNHGYDFHILKLNQQGQKVWDKYFTANNHDYLSATTSTHEGGFLLAGTSWSKQGLDKKEESFGGSDIWLIKIDEEGKEEWQKTIGTLDNEEAVSAVQTNDLYYFVAGNVSSTKEGFGSKDVLVIKLDPSGKVLNQLILGGKGLDEVQKMIPTKDGGVLVGIYSRSGITEKIKENTGKSSNNKEHLIPVSFIPKESDNFGQGDYWMVKLDKSGEIQWQRSFGGTEDDRVKTISLFEEGFLIGGESRSSSSGYKQVAIKEGTDLWFLALNEHGDDRWQKSYSFGNRDVVMSQTIINDVSGNKTKGFLIGGYTQSDGKIEKDDETFWMLYLDRKGDEVWRKHIEGKSKQKEERLIDAKLQNDGTFILAGTSAEEIGKEQWKIVKLGDKDLDTLIEKQEMRIYPNPVGDYAYVEIGFELKSEAEIKLHDMSGRQLQQLKTKNKVTKINTSMLPQGVYIVTARTKNKIVNTKIVKK